MEKEKIDIVQLQLSKPLWRRKKYRYCKTRAYKTFVEKEKINIVRLELTKPLWRKKK